MDSAVLFTEAGAGLVEGEGPGVVAALLGIGSNTKDGVAVGVFRILAGLTVRIVSKVKGLALSSAQALGRISMQATELSICPFCVKTALAVL